MGNSTSSPQPQRVASSTPSSKPSPIRKDDPLPATANIDGISVGSSQGCSQCIFTVTQGISSSAATIYRNQAMISSETCNRFNIDVQSVKDNKLSIETFKRNLQTGTYYQPNNDGTCVKIFFNPTDLAAVTKIEDIPWNKATKGEVKTMSDSPIALSSTKLMIKPSIPFRIFFNGEQIDVKLLTLFHPSPIRVENVQHDAVLTLGDPADASAKTIVMIPLAGSILPGQTSSFIAKIATYIPGALIANASTGLFQSVDVPTGNDWNLSTLLPGSPRNGENVVNVGYFSWETAPKLEAKLRNIVRAPDNLPDVYEYGWKPSENSSSTRYIMLKDPISINSFDLQTIRMLPITNATDAIPPPLIDTLVYSPPTTCKDKPYDKSCDPFANLPVNKPLDPDIIWQTILGILGGFFVLVGIYFAIKYASDVKWGLWLKNTATGLKNVSPFMVIFIILAIGAIVTFIIPLAVVTGIDNRILYGIGGVFSLFVLLAAFNYFRSTRSPSSTSSATSYAAGPLPTLLPAAGPSGTFGINNVLPNPAAGTNLFPTRKITPKQKPVTQAQVTAAKKINEGLKNELAKRQRALQRANPRPPPIVPLSRQVTSSTPGKRRNVSTT